MLVHEMLEQPLRWREPRLVFVNSMSDLFHEKVPETFILEVFDVMRRASQHTFQILTKRAERLAELAPKIDWPSNVWMGVSIECDDYVARADSLRATTAAVKFLSLEPLLDPLPSLDLRQLDWVIVGGESGPGARDMRASWVRSLRARCRAERIPFFFKQWGGTWKKEAGRELDGRTYDEMPEVWGKVHERSREVPLRR
jgi:protein gp37